MSGKMNDSHAIKVLAWGVALCLVVWALGVAAYRLIYQGPRDVVVATADGAVRVVDAGYDLFKRIGSDFYRALQFEPTVTIGEVTVHGSAEAVTEVATATKDFEHSYSYEARWAGSTKRLELKGEFTAKAGFRVDDAFALVIAPDGKTVTLRHRPPVLLSCELKKLRVIKEEDGWWNKLQPKERESAQNELLRRARERALDDDLARAAVDSLLDRLRPLQQAHAFEVTSDEVP